MTMPISLPRSSISPVSPQHGLPVMRRVPMLRGCSSSLKQKPPRSVPPSSSAASWRQRSSCADCSLALPTSRRHVSAPEPSPAGSRYQWRRVRSGGGSRVGAGRPDPRPAISAYSMDKPALRDFSDWGGRGQATFFLFSVRSVDCGFNHARNRVAVQRRQGASGRDRRWLRARRLSRCLEGYRGVPRASRRTRPAA